jgi:hypothetical protein
MATRHVTYTLENAQVTLDRNADMDLINEIEANGYLAKDDVTNPEADIIEEGALVLTVDGERIVVAEEDLTRGNI